MRRRLWYRPKEAGPYEALRRAHASPEPPRRNWRWLLLAFIIGWLALVGIGAGWNYLIAHALPAPALLTHEEPLHLDEVKAVRLPDGREMKVRYKGEIPLGATYGPMEISIGNMYKYGHHFWVWAIPWGGTEPNGVDP